MTVHEAPDLFEVVLSEVSTGLFLDYLEHLDGLLHEIRLVDAGTTAGVTRVGPELADLIGSIVDYHADAFGTAREQADRARARGERTFELTLTLPAASGGAATELIGLLDRADELAEKGALLALPAKPAIRELRHRLRDQVVDQLARPNQRPA